MKSQTPLDEQLLHPLEHSEAIVEKVLFRNRRSVVVATSILTLVLLVFALSTTMSASFDKMIPASHPYIANYLQYKDDVRPLGNAIRIAVETTEQDIYTAQFQEILKQINDDVFFIAGIDRAGLKSIWTPNVRWTEVTEEGFVGGPVIPESYDGSSSELDKLRANVNKSGSIGSLVSNNSRSAMIIAPLLETDPESGQPIDYDHISQQLERLIRDKYESETVKIHITGFAKVVGDLIQGATEVGVFFATAIIITLILMYLYSRCWTGTLIPLLCSIIAVIWQLGLLQMLNLDLDPYSMLVPFLVFAIGISHGVQIVNAVASERAKGYSNLQSARHAFRVLYIPGAIALLSDGIGFITLMVIDIDVIQGLALAASLGIASIIVTNLILLPILLSYTGVRPSDNQALASDFLWRVLKNATQLPYAVLIVVVSSVLLVISADYSQNLKIGDLDKGAPELRSDSRYNQDNAFITENFSTSTDLFVVMVQTLDGECVSYQTLALVEDFQHTIGEVEGVQSTYSMVDVAKRGMVGMNEGNAKWASLSRNELVMNSATSGKHVPPGMINSNCNFLPIIVYLNDHKAETLQRVSQTAEMYAQDTSNDQVTFKLAAGNSGIEAATNQVIETAQYEMLIWVYGVVGVLVLLTFRSLKTVICILAPLAMTSVLCQALMTYLGIGVKVATLPVIALGVGIGVDYGLYIYSRLRQYLLCGETLESAYLHTLRTTGRAVAFTGMTLAIGVGSWIWSPIKFQADMGILLTFMFLWNMLGALVIIPALTRLVIRTPNPI